ncbi:MAG: hypothetical protein RL077_1621 [Verrucomicrobiota bacterium]
MRKEGGQQRFMPLRYAAADLISFAGDLLEKAGLERSKAEAVAVILVEGDLLGHTTHGLALLPAYLGEIANGGMTRTGEPEVVADFPAAVTWDGRRLPGPWLVGRALELAIVRAKLNGVCSVAIRRSHHIGCLAAYLKRVTDAGLMVLLTCSDPNVCSVAPFGGRREVFTPNPLAAAWPTAGDPVMMDISMSITTNGLSKRLHTAGKRFPGPWALTAGGAATDDPAVLFENPPGTLLPIGGLDHGHKGYALALLVEALTGALAGHGRADAKAGWGATVYIQVFNPACFGGAEEFLRQSTHVAEACRATPPLEGGAKVRLPGESGLRRRAEQSAHGVNLQESILPAILPWSTRLGVPLPPARAGRE